MNLDRRTRSDRLSIPYVALALGLITLVLAALGGWSYTGLVNRLGEWQFASFGVYFNLASILLFVALLALVWRIGGFLAKKRRSDEENPESDELTDLRENLQRTTIAKRITGWLGLATVLAAFITVIYLVLLPSEDMKVREITADQAARGPEGPVVLRGVSPVGQTARYRQGFLFWQRTYYFVPIAMETAGDDQSRATVFLEVPEKFARSNVAVNTKGILRHKTLPDEVTSMYRAANFPVEDNASVIFTNGASSNWTTRVLLYDMLLIGLLFLLFNLYLRRRVRRLDKEIINH